MHFSSHISLRAFLPSTIRVRSFLRRFFFAYAIRRLLRQRVPVRGPWIGRTGALNKVAIKRAKSYAADCMPSQGLGPRQSVLPLLISFLFSHIVLAELSFPLRLLSFSFLRPYSLSLSLSSHHSFPSSFFFLRFSPFPLHISPRGLSLSSACGLSPHRGNPRVRFSPRERKFLFLFLSHIAFRAFVIDSDDDLSPDPLVDSIGAACYYLPILIRPVVRWISHESDNCIRFKKSI